MDAWWIVDGAAQKNSAARPREPTLFSADLARRRRGESMGMGCCLSFCRALLDSAAAGSETDKALFQCWIYFNLCVLVWIEVKFSSNSTPVHLNIYGLM
jgi:hypothetical protein